MTVPPATLSQRLLRKGAFVEESFLLFSNWKKGTPIEEALKSTLEGTFKTVSWSAEVSVTLRRRFRDINADDALVTAARHLPIEEWRNCLLLWIGIHELLYREFALEWLYPEFLRGRLFVRSEDICDLVRELARKYARDQEGWSDYGIVRTARDLIRMASDFHLLVGRGPAKQFRSFHLSDRCFLYFAHMISEVEGNPSKVPSSNLWRLALMGPSDVEHELLRLHQFRQLDYQVAGSLVQLSLPCSSAREYAERIAA